MTVSRFVLVDFRYTSNPLGHIRLYEAGDTLSRKKSCFFAPPRPLIQRHNAMANLNI